MQGDFYKDKISTTTNSTIEKKSIIVPCLLKFFSNVRWNFG